MKKMLVFLTSILAISAFALTPVSAGGMAIVGQPTIVAGSEEYNTAINETKARVSDPNYNLSSYKCTQMGYGTEFRGYGWVTLTDRITGAGVKHYTTVQMEDGDGNVHASSGRVEGVGFVEAWTKYLPYIASPYVYYGY